MTAEKHNREANLAEAIRLRFRPFGGVGELPRTSAGNAARMASEGLVRRQGAPAWRIGVGPVGSPPGSTGHWVPSVTRLIWF
jgi:hypothetical protein